MPAKSVSTANTRKLMRLGKTSLCVTLPMEYIKKLGWREKQKVTVELKGKSMVIKDWK
jgi:antitoxin component of MazEF toxin-antitoxin module